MNWKSDLIRSRAGRFVLERVAKFYDQFVCTAGAVRRQARKPRKVGTGLRFSVGIPHYNRGKLIYRPLFNLLNHPVVDEVVIVDDGSRLEEYQSLKDFVDSLDCGDRVKIFRRVENRGALLTKLECVERSSSEWVLVLDSDNTAFSSYLDALGGIRNPDPQMIYCASWAWPYFAFQDLGVDKIDFELACELVKSSLLKKIYLINDGNFLVHRQKHLFSIKEISNFEIEAADVMLVNYKWLSDGGSLKLLDNVSYFHRVDGSSFWSRTVEVSKKRVQEIFKRFEHGERCREDFLVGLRSGKL
jgi:glycosyltransferase involved in cell wall biosynthesis